LLSKQDYTAPWNEKLPDGSMTEYGPSPSTHARQAAQHALWSWRPPRLPSRISVSPEANSVRAYVRPGGLQLRGDIPRRELEVYLYCFEMGRSLGWVAKRLKIHRSSVRMYLRRLRERVGV